MIRDVDRRTFAEKNRAYLESLRSGRRDYDIRAQILDAVFDTTGDAILVFDETKRIVLANCEAVRLSQLEMEDTSRQWLHEHFKFYKDEHTLLQVPVEQEPLEVAMREKRPCLMKYFVRPTAAPEFGRWLESKASPVIDSDGNVVGGITIFRDITETTQSTFQRDCLMSLIAHDLKNHLAAESILLKLVESVSGDAEFAEVSQTLAQANERFVGMTESLMELARSEFLFANMGGQAVDLDRVLTSAIADHAPQCRDKQIECRLELPPDFPAAYGLMAVIQQIFTNVMLNAIEASPPRSTVDIGGKVSETGNPVVLITDHGPGISPEKVETLFDPHRVATHEKQTSHSTGFGLYLTAMLLRSIGGSIRCESTEGEGTTMQIELVRVPE